MKGGYIIKSGFNESTKEDELALINNYTRRNLTEDEVYVFSVVLCDNDIDRDFEMFTKEALDKLAILFVGKTGIMNHDMKAENQMARVISCKVEMVAGKTNALGQPYYHLLARAYMPRSEKNNDLILEIDSGIKKEVSVSCSVEKMICSICGCNMKTEVCEHERGKKYVKNGLEETCFVILDNPLDAYEWSFVAVPAQREAGVVKAFDSEGGEKYWQSVIKAIDVGEKVSFDRRQITKLRNFIEALRLQAEDGKIYREDLQEEVLRLYSKVNSDISLKTLKSVVNKMTIDELKEFRDSFIREFNKKTVIKPQLIHEKQENVVEDNIQFKI